MAEPRSARSRFLWKVAPPASRGVGRLFFGMRAEFESELPSPPFVVAANHYSHFDSSAIAGVLGIPIRFLALDDLFGVNPILDWLVTGFEAIPTPRDRVPVGAVRTALGALESGGVVGVFPEATRVSHWGVLQPKRGAAWLAARTGVPLVPVAVIGTGRAFGLENRLHRAQIRVIVGKPIEAEPGDVEGLTSGWSDWIAGQVIRHPGSETSGPRRSHFVGPP